MNHPEMVNCSKVVLPEQNLEIFKVHKLNKTKNHCPCLYLHFLKCK